VSIELAPGQTLGVVGPTGAGKSTLVNLLLRHYVPLQGTVSWGGRRIEDYRLEALRSAVAWVPQEPFLFSASIAQNIRLARADATPRKRSRQARGWRTCANDVRRFADGYDTLVGERGVTLSGGQRQRVAIARALLTDTPLLVLDDALSAVDTGTETRILEHLRGARAGARRSSSATGCRRWPMPTRSSCSRAAGSPSAARTPSCWRRTAGTQRSGATSKLEASLDAA